MSEEDDKKTAEEWKPTAEREDAMNYILAITKCPKPVRALLNFLVGISDGRLEFDTTHGEIASRVSGTAYLLVDESPVMGVNLLGF